MNKELESRIQTIILETFEDQKREWVSYFQHKAKQMNLDKKSFFIGMMYPKVINNLGEQYSHPYQSRLLGRS